MNFDRSYKAQTVRDKKTSSSLASKIQKLPILSRIYLYIFLMATMGMAVGEGRYRLEAQNCNSNSDCWLVEPAQRRAKDIGIGATAGIIAATLISIPALLEDK